MPGSWGHLAARFFDVVSARPLSEDDWRLVDDLLHAGEGKVYRSQTRADQRHGLEAALHVRHQLPERTDLIRAALLHDVGKHRSHLGAVGRVVASIGGRLGLRLAGRLADYLDHGPIGATLLERLGAEEVVVAFARHHHGERPEGFAEDEWALLEVADQARVRRRPRTDRRAGSRYAG